jgi:hypothetical protein
MPFPHQCYFPNQIASLPLSVVTAINYYHNHVAAREIAREGSVGHDDLDAGGMQHRQIALADALVCDDDVYLIQIAHDVARSLKF